MSGLTASFNAQTPETLPKTLIEAVIQQDLSAVQMFLEQGHSSDVPGERGCTALSLAIEAGHARIVRLFLERDADIEKKAWTLFSMFSMTPLGIAAHQGRLEVARLLLEHGADVHHADEFGHTPLMLAVGERNTEIARLLLEAGARPDAETQAGYTALHRAASRGFDEIVDLLLDRNARRDITTRNGDTPLSFAKIHRHKTCVDMLEEPPESRLKRNDDRAKTAAAEMEKSIRASVVLQHDMPAGFVLRVSHPSFSRKKR